VRLFVALDIPEEVRAGIGALIEKLRSVCRGARWVRIEGAHVTLKFIGHVATEQTEEIKSALSKVPFPAEIHINFRSLGFFPNERRPRVLWAGIENGAKLGAVAAEMDAVLEPLGIAREQRAFSPHLTLARFDSPKGLDGLRAAIAAEASLEFGSANATAFHLYQSVLKRNGAEYTRLATFNVQGSTPRSKRSA
jgi:2'-5' RNA ligase